VGDEEERQGFNQMGKGYSPVMRRTSSRVQPGDEEDRQGFNRVMTYRKLLDNRLGCKVEVREGVKLGNERLQRRQGSGGRGEGGQSLVTSRKMSLSKPRHCENQGIVRVKALAL
jgi:hypothetical protein